MPIPSLSDALQQRYAIVRELGRGGMATVYLARDLRHDLPVALKVMHQELAASLGPERFLREIRITAQLQHPHILPLLDSGGESSLLWYTMPYVEGENLRQRIAREKQLGIDDAVLIARQVASAIGYAHGRDSVSGAGETARASFRHVRWIGDLGRAQPQQAGGVYFYHIEAGDARRVGRFTVVNFAE